MTLLLNIPMGRVDELEDAGHVTTRLAVGWDAAESSHRGFASIVGCQRIGNLELVKERSQVGCTSPKWHG